MGLGPTISFLRGSHCGFCDFRCDDILFGVQHIFFFFLWIPLPGVFPLVIYLFILAMVPTLRFSEQHGEP
jgi:hypothetical protein